MIKFKKHKLPGIDINVCCKEQKIAYDYLFSWTLNTHYITTGEKNYILSCIQKELCEKANGTYNELYKPFHPIKYGGVDYDLVYHYILTSYDRYVKAGAPIFSNYETLASIIY